jgi:hypothetical protein
MKRCSRCKKEKPVEEFNFKNKALGIRQKSCRSCTRLEIRNHYLENKNYYIKKAKKRNKEKSKEIQEFILKYLSKHPCIDCGEKDPVVLDFDHKGDKIASVSDIIRKGHSVKAILEEISKCEVRCANCHRRKTAKEFGWYKTKHKPL